MNLVYTLTVIGPDRDDLAKVLAAALAVHRANWEESRFARLDGQVAGILRARLPEEEVAGLLATLATLTASGLHIACERAGASVTAPAAPARGVRLSLVGQDHPGIIHQISHALLSRGIAVDLLETRYRSASMSGEQLFEADAILVLPAGASTGELRTLLESLANELMIDICLGEAPSGR
jgi:glycine cleavage system regulatory protein